MPPGRNMHPWEYTIMCRTWVELGFMKMDAVQDGAVYGWVDDDN